MFLEEEAMLFFVFLDALYVSTDHKNLKLSAQISTRITFKWQETTLLLIIEPLDIMHVSCVFVFVFV